MISFRNLIVFFAVLLAFVSCISGTQKDIAIAVVPQPNEIVKHEGNFVVTSRTTFVVPENEALHAAVGLVII